MASRPDRATGENRAIYSSILRQLCERGYDQIVDELALSALAEQLADPGLAIADVSVVTGLPVSDILSANLLAGRISSLRDYVKSLRYPYRLRNRFSASTAAEFLREPDRLERILSGRPVLASTVELHPSLGTCNYSCTMCLWSNKDDLTYASKDLTARGLLNTDDWLALLDELWRGGARNVVFSGGGEVLLNKAIGRIIEHAVALGFSVSMYTTGYLLDRAEPNVWRSIARMRQMRLSVHSPHEETYNQITGHPKRARALQRVVDNLKQLHTLRGESSGSSLRIGFGFVLQPLNYSEVLEMARYSAELGTDFLDIRKDEVDVTEALDPAAINEVRSQLTTIRQRAERGDYRSTNVDISDELVMLADNLVAPKVRSVECLAKYFRPTISPYGLVAPCDLKAEPRFANSAFNLGLVPIDSIGGVLENMNRTTIPDSCVACMPSSRTGNLVWSKLVRDASSGIDLSRILSHTLCGP